MTATAKQTGVRFTPSDLALLDALQARLGVNRTDVLRIAVRRLAALEGVKVSEPRSKRPKK